VKFDGKMKEKKTFLNTLTKDLLLLKFFSYFVMFMLCVLRDKKKVRKETVLKESNRRFNLKVCVFESKRSF